MGAYNGNPPLWSCGLGPVVRGRRVKRGYYGEFMVLGGYRYASSPDGDHTIGVGRGGGGLRNAEHGCILLPKGSIEFRVLCG